MLARMIKRDKPKMRFVIKEIPDISGRRMDKIKGMD
jgi:hypothetical protein